MNRNFRKIDSSSTKEGELIVKERWNSYINVNHKFCASKNTQLTKVRDMEIQKMAVLEEQRSCLINQACRPWNYHRLWKKPIREDSSTSRPRVISRTCSLKDFPCCPEHLEGCLMAFFFRHPPGLPDPPTKSQAPGRSVQAESQLLPRPLQMLGGSGRSMGSSSLNHAAKTVD